MGLFLHRASEPQQLVRNGLVGGFENVDEGPRERFVLLGEERDGESGGAGPTGSETRAREE